MTRGRWVLLKMIPGVEIPGGRRYPSYQPFPGEPLRSVYAHLISNYLRVVLKKRKL